MATLFCRDPYSFYALAASCRMAAAALGDDFYPYADVGYTQIWVDRLCLRVNARSTEKMEVYCRKVFDEKARYVRLASGTAFLADVDKMTGLVLNTQHTRSMGKVTVREPETYFSINITLHLKSYRTTVNEDPGYAVAAKTHMIEYTNATEHLKKTSSVAKKRLFSDVWDENQLRRKRYRYQK